MYEVKIVGLPLWQQPKLAKNTEFLSGNCGWPCTLSKACMCTDTPCWFNVRNETAKLSRNKWIYDFKVYTTLSIIQYKESCVKWSCEHRRVTSIRQHIKLAENILLLTSSFIWSCTLSKTSTQISLDSAFEKKKLPNRPENLYMQ